MKTLKGTKTAENLLKAFAGESQARNRYTFYASAAKKEGYVQIYNIFMETAENEKEHAKIFYKFLLNDFQDENIKIDGTYPIALHGDTLSNLKAAANGENEEWSEMYPAFAEVAKEEGFEQISIAFSKISEIEKHHSNRFNKLAQNIENDMVFKRDEVKLWKCNNCGYIFEGKEAPQKCPACLHPRAYFEILSENY